MSTKTSMIAAVAAISTTVSDAIQAVLDREARGLGNGDDMVRIKVAALKTALDAIDTAQSTAATCATNLDSLS